MTGAKKPGEVRGNIAFSPFSLWSALTMTSGGAAGATLKEMQSALHNADGGTASSEIHARASEWTDRLTATEGVDLRIANRLFGAPDFTATPAFDELIQKRYHGAMERVPFAKDSEGARTHINKWVSQQTAERIPKLLNPLDVTRDTRLILINAIYFKAAWSQPFSPEATRNLPFTRASGAVVQTPAMMTRGDLPYFETADFQVISLSYAKEKAALIVLLPAKDKPALVPTAALFTQVRAGLQNQKVIVQLPRFEVEQRLDFVPLLGTLGMKLAFNPQADFSALSTTEPLRISKVIHQANIKVGEKGTEAAAATAVLAAPGGMPPREEIKPKEFLANRPFYFFITHEATGGILFLGKVDEPEIAK